MPYGFYITDKGRELIDKAIPNEQKVEITKACFGSGGNPETDREYGITDLKNQFYEKTLTPDTDTYQVDENDPYSLYIRTVVPDDVTGTINEVGYKDSEDNLIIYGVVQQRVKEQSVSGGGFKIQYDNWIKLENGDVDKIDVKVLSPEYERVDRLVESAKAEFDERIDQVEKEFNIDNYPSQEDFNEATDEEIEEVFQMSGSGGSSPSYPEDWEEATESDIDALFN